MHELRIARNIATIVEEEVHDQDQEIKKVTRILFKAGRMNKIVPELLYSNFTQIKKNRKLLEEADLIMEEIPIEIKCKECGASTKIEKPLFKCQVCKSEDIEIISGQEMYIEDIYFD